MGPTAHLIGESLPVLRKEGRRAKQSPGTVLRKSSNIIVEEDPGSNLHVEFTRVIQATPSRPAQTPRRGHSPDIIHLEQLTEMVGTLGIQNYMLFFDEDLSPLGKDHDQALHIIVEIRGMVVPQCPD